MRKLSYGLCDQTDRPVRQDENDVNVFGDLFKPFSRVTAIGLTLISSVSETLV
jgi:hypothetical protein